MPMTLRDAVIGLMVRVNLVSRELAESWTEDMDEVELARRFSWFMRNGDEISEMELSAVGPTHRAGNVFTTRFSRPATMTAGPRHSTLFPSSRPSEPAGRAMPDSETKNLVRDPSRAVSAARSD
jgi:hypothetical protein